jgi:hypothetical protein
MTSMTITIERTPRTLQFEGTAIEVEELSVRLPFARKPADLSEVGGEGNYKVFVTETREMTPKSSMPLPINCSSHATGSMARAATLRTAGFALRSAPSADPFCTSTPPVEITVATLPVWVKSLKATPSV